jgi:[acyl-carrier-protein] S-malonyltransferase
MAASLLHDPAAAALLDAAAATGLDLREALQGDDHALRPTNVAQPALLFVECALLASLPTGLEVVAVAGHSVGEYAACVAAGALDPVMAMRLVIARATAMAAMREGTMAALLGLSGEVIEAVCADASRQTGETVVIANLNAPEQVVVSGTRAAVDATIRIAGERGLRRAVGLNVSGAFHSPLMAEAAATFAGALDATALRDPRMPVVCNVDAAPCSDATSLRDRLRRQLTGAVRWSDSVHTLVALGAETLIEVGPGTVLTGLARRIVPGTQAVAVNDAAGALQIGSAGVKP